MSRFSPESWQEALLRPLAMTSPEAGVYVEFAAPDFRFVLALALLLACLLLRRRVPPGLKPVLATAGFIGLGFVTWLQTSGNGRYFLPVLLLAGPLAVGLAHWLPATRSLRLTAAFAMVLWQGFLLLQASPWGVWTHVQWRSSPPFRMEVPAEWQREPATYVTLSSLSYAIVAPQFHRQSRWINVSEWAGTASAHRVAPQVATFLAQGDPLRVLFPALAPVPAGEPPDRELADTVDRLLVRQDLSLADRSACRLLPSSLLRSRRVERTDDAGARGTMGFWVCPLAREARRPKEDAPEAPSMVDRVFDRVERACPGVFPPGHPNLPIPDGMLRSYTAMDTRLYVLDNGEVLSRYYRSLNPVRIGSVADVLDAGFRMDCNLVRRRAALPWQREP